MTRNKNQSKIHDVVSKVAACGLAVGMAIGPNVTNIHAINETRANITNSGYKVTRNHDLIDPITGYNLGSGGTDDTGNITINGQVVFCVDGGTLANSSIPLLQYKGYSGFADIGYSAAQVDLMQRIVSVGYNMDHSNEMRAATQLRIWQVRYPNGYSNIPAAVQAKINDINARLAVYDKTVDFKIKSGEGSYSGNQLNLKGYGEEHAVTLTDSSGVFSNYVHDNGASLGNGVHLEKSGNDLKVWVEKNGNSDGRIVYDSFYLMDTATAPIVYVAKQNQSMGCFGNADPQKMAFSYSVESDVKSSSVSSKKTGDGNIQLQVDLTKTDAASGKGISGVEFELYRQELNDEGQQVETKIADLTTDKKGKINTTIDQKSQFTSARYTANYLINPDDLTEEQMQAAIGKGWYKTKAEAQAYVDAKAQNDLNRRISVYNGQKFTYVLKEVKTGQGYYLDATNSSWKSEEITGSGKLSYSIKNKASEGQLTITKTGLSLSSAKTEEKDGETKTTFTYQNAGLIGAEFDIIANEDIKDPADGTVKYKKGTVVQHLITSGNDGSVVANSLPLGSYAVKETKAPKGYVLNETPQVVTLKYVNQTVELVSEKASFTNERTKLEVNVNKESKETKNKLEGAQFGLYSKDGISITKMKDGAITLETLVKPDALIETATTDESGKVTFESELPMGNYYVKELKAPKGYKLSDEVINITAKYDNDKAKTVVVDETMVDEFDKVTVKVNKVDEKKKAITGKDFEFTLYEDDCKTEIKKTKGDEKTGEATFKDLTIGDYCIKETKEPKGYTLSNEATKVSVKEYGKVFFNGKEVNPDEGQTIVYSMDFTNKEEVHTGVNTSSGKFVKMGIVSGITAAILAGIALLKHKKED